MIPIEATLKLYGLLTAQSVEGSLIEHFVRY